MPKKNKEITIRSSAAEYLTYKADIGDNEQSFETTKPKAIIDKLVRF